jgi:hypothetical protein
MCLQSSNTNLVQIIYRELETNASSLLTFSYDNFLVGFVNSNYLLFIQNYSSDVISMLDDIKHKNVSRLRPYKTFCNTIIPNRCVTHSRTKIFYSDNNHLSIQGAGLFVEDIVDLAFG